MGNLKLVTRAKATYALSCFLGAIFILSAVTKAINISAFAYEIRMYSDVYFSEYISYCAYPIAVAICAIESCIGVLALFPRFHKFGSIAMFGILFFFTWLTGNNYFCPSSIGSIESCGCFGEFIHFSPFGAFVKSLVLWVIATIILIANLHYKHSKQRQ